MRILNAGFIGCGGFARNMHMPLLLKSPKYKIKALMDINEEACKSAMSEIKGDYWTTDADKVFNDKDIDVVFITTTHDSHADLTIRAAKAKKHILCEKPMALNAEDCRKIAEAVKENNVKYTIGYNRGLAPLVTKAKDLLKETKNKKKMIYHRIQAPFPECHWTHIPEVGGGRFVGEGCHIFDLFSELIDKEPVSVYAAGGIFLDPKIVKIPDSAIVTIEYEDGSVATTLISSAGCPDFEKEATEIYCDNKAIYIDGFRTMKYFGFEGHKQTTLDIGVVDKGQEIEIDQLADAIIFNREAPNGINKAARAAIISYKVNESLKTGLPVGIKREEYMFL